MEPPFPCLQCGACCRATATFSDDTMARAGLTRGPQGWCAQLLPDNRCAIYDARPLLCRVGAVGKAWGIPQRVCFELSAAGCDTLMRNEGLDLIGLMPRRVKMVMVDS